MGRQVSAARPAVTPEDAPVDVPRPRLVPDRPPARWSRSRPLRLSAPVAVGRAVPGQPSLARVHHHALGGRDHYPQDRDAAARILAVYPRYREAVVASRAFALRAAGRLAASGITQVLDLGSGIPMRPMIHEVVRGVRPGARVVYVDDDRTAYVHGVLATSRASGVRYLRHDVRDVDGLLQRLDGDGTLDLGAPLGVVCCGLLHVLDDDEVRRLLGGLASAAAPGSRLAAAVLGVGSRPASARATLASRGLQRSLGRPLTLRSLGQVATLLADLPLLRPGLVDPRDWPGTDPARSCREPLHAVAGVARLGC